MALKLAAPIAEMLKYFRTWSPNRDSAWHPGVGRSSVTQCHRTLLCPRCPFQGTSCTLQSMEEIAAILSSYTNYLVWAELEGVEALEEP